MKRKNILLSLIMLMMISCSSNKHSISSNNISENRTEQTITSNNISSEKDSSISLSSPITNIELGNYPKSKNITKYIKEGEDIPSINITTNDGIFPSDKENYIPGSLNIINQTTKETILTDSSMGIRLRGNSTMRAPKKPFRIKFDSKTSLFGLPKAKSWVLLANYFDKSNMRNYLAYLTANKLSNLDFQPSSIFVDVYFNNQYQGLYLLTEQMQTGSGRINIENLEDENGNSSYLIELEFESRQEGTKDIDYFLNDGKSYTIKYPEDNTKETCNYIKDYMNKLITSLKNKKDYEELIDYKSFIDGYLVEEFFKNTDVGNSSCYYYLKPNDKLKFGPVWDFDIGLDVVTTSIVNNDYLNSTLWAYSQNNIFKYLLSIPEIKEYTKHRYTEVRQIFLETKTELEIAKTYLKDAQARNIKKWSLPGNMTDSIEKKYNNEYSSLKTIDQHYSFLEKKLEGRLKLLDKNYLL